MSLRVRMRQALPEAMRARDKATVSALRATLSALDNAEAVSVDEAELRGLALEQSPVGVGATEAPRRELSECRVADIVRAEATERLEAAAQLTAPAHADRVAGVRGEAAVFFLFLCGAVATILTFATPALVMPICLAAAWERSILRPFT